MFLFLLIETTFIWFQFKGTGYFPPPPLTSDWLLSVWKQKWGRWSKWFWHGQGVLLQGEWKIEGGLISLKNPSSCCGRGCLYCLVCFHGNSYGVRRSSCLLLLLSVQYLVKFPPLFPSLFFPLSPTCTDMVCSVLGGEYSGMRWRTHTQSVCVLLAEQTWGTMSLKKRLSFKRTWNFNTVSKLTSERPVAEAFLFSQLFFFLSH